MYWGDAAKYFKPIDPGYMCFCFVEQLLRKGQLISDKYTKHVYGIQSVGFIVL